jgi:limonene-1,2-epoxide hydrolase
MWHSIGMKSLVQKYFEAFQNKDLECIGKMLAPTATLQDPALGLVSGRSTVLKTYQKIFEGCEKMQLVLKRLFSDGNSSWAAEFSFSFEDTQGKSHTIGGVDLMEFEGDKIQSIRAYLDTRADS